MHGSFWIDPDCSVRRAAAVLTESIYFERALRQRFESYRERGPQEHRRDLRLVEPAAPLATCPARNVTQDPQTP